MTARGLVVAAVALVACSKPAPKDPAPEDQTASEAKPEAKKKNAGVLEKFKRARVDTACNEVQRLANAVEMYLLQANGKCPLSLQALKDEGLVDIVHPDPWKHPFEFSCTNGEFSIRSLGEDGKPDTEDDVTWVPGPQGCKRP